MDTLRLAGGWTVIASPSIRGMVEREAPAALAAAEDGSGGVVTSGRMLMEVSLDSAASPALRLRVGPGVASLSRNDTIFPGTISRLIGEAGRSAVWEAADPGLRAWEGEDLLSYSFDGLAGAARIRLQRDTGAQVRGCRSGSIIACEQALAGRPTDGRLPQFSTVVRASFLHFALERAGGVRALPRLYDRPDRPILDRIADLTGTSSDTLIRAWRDAVIDHGSFGAMGVIAALVGAGILLLIGARGLQWRRV